MEEKAPTYAALLQEITTTTANETFLKLFLASKVCDFDKIKFPLQDETLKQALLDLLCAHCAACLEQMDFWSAVQKQREEEEKLPQSHDDDDDCSGFEQMEHMEHWRSIHRSKCKATLKTIIDWWILHVDHVVSVPLTEEQLETHSDSECEKDCEDCMRRDRFRARRKQQALTNNHPQQLSTLLDTAQWGASFTVKAFKYSINGYLRDGILVEDKKFITLHFVKSDSRQGLLWNQKKTECWIHYATKECFWKKDKDIPFGRVILCPYRFTKRRVWQNKKQKTMVDTSDADSVRILYKDDVFEDYVHASEGFIIPNHEIDQHVRLHI